MKKIILLLGTTLSLICALQADTLCAVMYPQRHPAIHAIRTDALCAVMYKERALPAKNGNKSLNKLQAKNMLHREPLSESSPQLSYIKAYMDFFLHIDTYERNYDFPIRGYYLFDLNFDQVPELGVYHDSGGSMGGYFNFYYFHENKIAAILDHQNEPVQLSNYTQILADNENENIYLLKEMYLLAGNENSTYGYVREIINHGGIPRVYDVLKLNVNEDLNLLQYEKSNYDEDKYLLDPDRRDCLIAQYYSDSGWANIPPDQYYKLKRERIPLNNSFIDLRDTDVYFLGAIDGETEEYENIKITAEEINELFLKWLDKIK